MSNTIENYGVKDIKTLEGIEAIRLRPGIKSNCRCPLTRSDGTN